MKRVVYRPIGFVENAFKSPDDPRRIRNSDSILVLDEECVLAMGGLERLRHLIVIYHMDKAPGYREKVHPMGDKNTPVRGVLSTRSPCWPSPLGITVVEVLDVKGNRIRGSGLDALDGSPLLDIKPYEGHQLQAQRCPIRRGQIELKSFRGALNTRCLLLHLPQLCLTAC